MKKFLFLICPFIAIALLATTVFAQTTHNVITDRVRCTYHTEDGRISGKYTSYYLTGQIKAEGEFINGMRTGTWLVWDEKDNLIVQREFSDPFNYTQIIPKTPKEDPVKLLNTTRYEIKYNDEGYIEYYDITKEMVLWAKRIWRYVEHENNTLLFESNYFFSFLNNLATIDSITVYNPENDEFQTSFQASEVDTSGTILGFKIKEDAFIDRKRQVLETRILGICPVVINTSGDTIDLYWVYFPELRKFMAKEKISNNNLPSNIKTLDDLFFYRYFSGRIIKESNIYDRYISEYAENEIKEAERIEVSIIEAEHDFWMQLNGKCREKHE